MEQIVELNTTQHCSRVQQIQNYRCLSLRYGNRTVTCRKNSKLHKI